MPAPIKEDYAQEVINDRLKKDLLAKPATFRKFEIYTSSDPTTLSENNQSTVGSALLSDINKSAFLVNIAEKLATRIISDGTLTACDSSEKISNWLRREGNKILTSVFSTLMF